LSSDLITFDEKSFHEIAKLTGATTRETIVLPNLTINRSSEDDEGTTVPSGTFKIAQEGVAIYSKTAIFRPFINAYQYVEYDPVSNTYPNRSIVIKSFNEEPIDLLGGISCGKVAFKDQDKLGPEEQLRQKHIKCRRLMYGLVTMEDGVNTTGEATTVEDLPVLFRLASSNFIAPQDALKAITRLKHQYFQHSLELSLKREKKGATVYYLVQVKPNLKTSLEFTDDNMDTFRTFQEVIDRENGFIAAKWRTAKKNAVEEINVAQELELNDSVDDI
jgi:hypothetical protein